MATRNRSVRHFPAYCPDGLTEDVIDALIVSVTAAGETSAVVTTAVLDGSAAAAKRSRMLRRPATVSARNVPSHPEAA